MQLYIGVVAFVTALMSLPVSTSAQNKAKDLELLRGKSPSNSVLNEIYANKTWDWGAGGAYYSPDQTFIAYGDAPGNEYYATGRWYINYRGDVCTNAKWVGVGYRKFQISCTRHRDVDGTIYQQNRSNVWYVFRHNPPIKTDESFRLTEGNLISEGHKQMVEKFDKGRTF